MAKNLILNALVDNLGTYVEDLKKEHLKLSLSTGTIELTNLQLKRTALDSLNLPIKVERGLVRKLHLKIPWTNLGKKPVIAVLEGFLLEARPIDLSALTASESQRLVLNYKLGIIEAAERAITAMLHTNSSSSNGGDSGVKKLSYLQQLTIKIIDNIEVKVSNVHLRFEDALVVSGEKLPGRAIACGVTIDSLTFSTTDSAWKTTFISRGDVDHRADDSPKHGVPIIHKLAVLRNLGVYWNPIAVSSETKSFSEWVHKMITLIRDASTGSSRSTMQSMSTDNDDDDKESTQYIVHPSNQCSLKIKHCSISSDLQPNVDLHVSSDPLMISISDEQLHQIIYVANFFADLNRRKLMISLRPKVRPTVDPRAWWQYAFKMISGVDDKFISKFQVMVECRKARSTYLPYWRTNIVVGELIRVVGGSDKDVKEWQSSHANELLLSDMRSIEMKLPLSALVAIRQEAAKAAISEVHRLQSDINSARAYLEKLHVPLSHSLSHSHASSIKRSTVTELNRLANSSSSSSSNAHTAMMTSYKEPVHAVSSFAASSSISAGSSLVSAKNKVFGAMKVFGFSSSSTSSTSSSIGKSLVGSTVAPKILRLLDDGLSNTCSVHSDQSVSKLSSSANSEEISEGGVNEENEDEDEDDELLVIEQQQLGGHHTEVTSKEQVFPFRVHVDPFSMVIQLYKGEGHKPVVRSSLRISSSCQMIRNSLSVELEMSNLTIHDSVSSNPVSKILLSTIKKMTTTKSTTSCSSCSSSSSDDGGRPSLSGSVSMGEGNICMNSLDSYTSGVTYNHHPAVVLSFTSNPKDKSVLQVKVMPIMVVWNQVCVQVICSMVLQPKQRPTYSQIVSRKLSEQASMIKELTTSSTPSMRQSVGINVRIEGLSLLMPLQHDSRTTSCLVLNIEQVCVLGTKDAATGGTLSVSMDAVSLSSIHSMQHLINDMMTVESKRGVKSEFIYDDDDEGDGDGDEGADSSRREDNIVDDSVNSLSGELNYIIKPFNVSVRIVQTPHHDTRLSLDVTITPTISVLIDVTKLTRVRAILDNLTTSLVLQNASSSSSSSPSSSLVHTTIDDNIKQDHSKRKHTHFTGDLDCMKRALVINLSLPPIVVTYMKSPTQFTQFSMSGIQFTVVDQFCDLPTKALKEASKLTVLALHCTGST